MIANAAEELTTLPLLAKLLQAPFGRCGIKSCNRTVRSTCQLHQRSQGGFQLKGICVLEVKLMCVAASGRSAPDIWLTFTVSTCQVTGFTRSVTRRMYTCCAQTLHAICIGPGRGHGDGVRPCPHLVGTVVPCRYRVGGSRGRYTHMSVETASRAAEMSSFYRTG